MRLKYEPSSEPLHISDDLTSGHYVDCIRGKEWTMSCVKCARATVGITSSIITCWFEFVWFRSFFVCVGVFVRFVCLFRSGCVCSGLFGFESFEPRARDCQNHLLRNPFVRVYLFVYYLLGCVCLFFIVWIYLGLVGYEMCDKHARDCQDHLLHHNLCVFLSRLSVLFWQGWVWRVNGREKWGCGITARMLSYWKSRFGCISRNFSEVWFRPYDT